MPPPQSKTVGAAAGRDRKPFSPTPPERELVGYARVSTRDQTATLQLDALHEAGCARVFEETASGASRDRPELAAALDYMRAGSVGARIGSRSFNNLNFVKDAFRGSNRHRSFRDNRNLPFNCELLSSRPHSRRA